ncbi:YbaB/EbfC family nucleoid-associated protein [Streptomyces sp. NPDC047046]|uniref:YbaB/EbfC family nucleoid-associated protein n=1 Tax=Streptomyces sp. NPDC047046 TaxID=3155378 RepID=UPI0033C60E04
MTEEPDLDSVLERMEELRRRLVTAHTGRSTEGATGSAGGGLVRAEVNAAGELQHLRISTLLADPADTHTLAATVLAAVRDAQDTVVARYRARFRDLLD